MCIKIVSGFQVQVSGFRLQVQVLWIDLDLLVGQVGVGGGGEVMVDNVVGEGDSLQVGFVEKRVG